jgi:hypothetical protein
MLAEDHAMAVRTAVSDELRIHRAEIDTEFAKFAGRLDGADRDREQLRAGQHEIRQELQVLALHLPYHTDSET